jgi:hypothetical protein
MKMATLDRFTVLLGSLLAVAIVSPIVQELSGLGPSVTFWLFVILPLVAGVYAIAASRRFLIVLVAIGSLAMIARWTDPVPEGGALLLVSAGLTAVFFGLIAVAIVLSVLKSQRVTMGVISAALCVYLLFGFVMALIYFIIHALEPAAFVLKSGELSDFIYFSFVTLSTVGYGDITPVAPIVRSFAYVEAIAGQFYMAVLISRLVALHVTHASAEPSAQHAGTSQAVAPPDRPELTPIS